MSLVGRDRPPTASSAQEGSNDAPRIWLAQVAQEVEDEVGGKIVTEEEVAKKKEEVNGKGPTVLSVDNGVQSTSSEDHHSVDAKYCKGL